MMPPLRAAQRLVRGRRHHVRVRHRIRIHAGGDQARDVRHVDHEPGAHRIGNLAHARPVDHPGVGRETADQHLRLVLFRQLGHALVIDLAGIVIQAVVHGVEDLAGEIHLGPVGQVAALGQIHAQNRVAGLEQRQVNGLIGLRARVRLDICISRVVELARSFDGQLLGDVDEFAAAVVAPTGIALGVLVGQLRALGFEHARRSVILRGDQLDVIFLALVSPAIARASSSS